MIPNQKQWQQILYCVCQTVRTSVLHCQHVFKVDQIELTLIKDYYIEYIVMQESMNMVQENLYSL